MQPLDAYLPGSLSIPALLSVNRMPSSSSRVGPDRVPPTEGPRKSDPLALQLFSAVSQSTWTFAWLRPEVLMALRGHTEEQEAALVGGREGRQGDMTAVGHQSHRGLGMAGSVLQLPFYR